MENNETNYVKIAGKVNVPKKVEIGHNYKLIADCSVTSEQRIDNENGTFDVVSKMVPIHVEIQKDNGPIIKAKDPRKNSQKFRNYLVRLYEESEAITYDFDLVYEKVIYKAMAEMPRLLRLAIKELQDNE